MNKYSHKNSWSDREVERFWDSVARIYVEENAKVSITHKQRFQEALRFLELREDISLLNISSRDGGADDYLQMSHKRLEIVHAEISRELIETARAIRPNIVQKKIETYSNLPFEDERFARILSLETIEHVSDPEKFLCELHRVAKNRAILVLSCPPATSELPYRLYTKCVGGHGEGPHRFLSSKEVKTMLSKSKWRLVNHSGTLLVPVGPEWLRKLGELIIRKLQKSFVSELGIRQFYVCVKY